MENRNVDAGAVALQKRRAHRVMSLFTNLWEFVHAIVSAKVGGVNQPPLRHNRLMPAFSDYRVAPNIVRN
jgi:hypothetical protein